MNVLDKLNLEGKTAIVTGAGRGLGRAMSVALAEAGANVVVTARTKEQIDETAELVREAGSNALAVSCDVTDSASVNAMIEATVSEFGRLDILVNNAGGYTVGYNDELTDVTDETWRVGIDTNLTGAVYCCRAAIPHMLEGAEAGQGRGLPAGGRGKIINVTSGFGLRAGRNIFMYTSAKAGLINFTRSLSMTYGDRIQANLIAPGLFPHDNQAMIDWWKGGKFVPMGRLGRDEELGPVTVFLASPLSDYMNGQIIVLDGGGLAGGHVPTGFAPVVPLEQGA